MQFFVGEKFMTSLLQLIYHFGDISPLSACVAQHQRFHYTHIFGI